jgi:hypothetical protein
MLLSFISAARSRNPDRACATDRCGSSGSAFGADLGHGQHQVDADADQVLRAAIAARSSRLCCASSKASLKKLNFIETGVSLGASASAHHRMMDRDDGCFCFK